MENTIHVDGAHGQSLMEYNPSTIVEVPEPSQDESNNSIVVMQIPGKMPTEQEMSFPMHQEQL